MGICIQYLVAVFAIVAVPLYYYFTKLRRIKKYCENYPSPPGKFFLHNALDFKSTEHFVPALHKYTKEHGEIVHLRVGPFVHGLIASEPKFLEFVLTNPKILQRSYNVRQFLKPWLGDGLITANGDAGWKAHRKLITPAFHFKILEQFIDVFEACGDVLIEKLSKESGNESVDVYPYITRYALDVVFETAMGIKANIQDSENSEYFESVNHMCRLFTVRSINLLKGSDFIFKMTDDYAIQQKAVKILHDFSDQVIIRKRELLKKKHSEENKDVEDVDDLGIKKRKVFLDVLLEASLNGQPLSHEEIRDEVDTFMFGGHDTTATTTCYVLYCLAHNKEAQEKVFEEQKQIYGDDLKNAKATYANLQEMKYLENVIKESMRLYSTVPLFGRYIDSDVEYDGKIVPKGLQVLIFVQGVHMNPKYYPNPEKFDPTRWEKTDGRPTFAYIPFAAGSRNCIGQKYAMLEVKCSVAKIVRNFELFPASPEHKLRLAAETVLKSLNGVKVGLKLR